MTRFLIRFLLALSLPFLGGCTHAGLHHYWHAGAGAGVNENPGPDQMALVTRTPPPATRKGYDRIKAVEIEEDEDLDHKHQETGSNYLPCFYTTSPVYTPHYNSVRLPLCEHTSYLSSSRYLFLCVIRV